MHHVSLIRSVAGNNGDHGRASYELQTSHTMSQSVVHPSMGSIAVHERDPLGDLPAFISISGNAPRAGYLGQRCEAYYVGRPGERDPYLAFPAGIGDVRGHKRMDLLARMNLRHSGKLNSADMKSAETAISKAVDLMQSPALKQFELAGVDPKVLSKYGDTEFGRGALLAKRLIKSGVRFVQVNRGGFDNHSNIFDAMQNHGDVMDPPSPPSSAIFTTRASCPKPWLSCSVNLVEPRASIKTVGGTTTPDASAASSQAAA